MAWWIVKRQFLGGGWFEELRPSEQVCPRDIERAGRKFGVSPGDAVPKFIEGSVEEAEDDVGTGGAGFFPAGVAFCP